MAQFLLLRINGDLKIKGLKDYFALVLFELDDGWPGVEEEG